MGGRGDQPVPGGVTQAIPAVAIAPLLVLWIGYGLGPVIVLCALIVFFPILISTVIGLRHVDADVVDAARMDGAGGWQLLTQVEFPMALASVLGGVRNGVTLSVTGAIVGEMVMGGGGLGTVLTVQRDSFDTAGMIATVIVLALIASSAYCRHPPLGAQLPGNRVFPQVLKGNITCVSPCWPLCVGRPSSALAGCSGPRVDAHARAPPPNWLRPPSG